MMTLNISVLPDGRVQLLRGFQFITLHEEEFAEVHKVLTERLEQIDKQDKTPEVII